jgi:cystathionine gamma-synthase
VEKRLDFATRQLHADGHGKPLHAHSMPIFQSSTFAFESPEHGADLFAKKAQGHIYTRLGNPTTQALETVVADLENADEAIAFSSGMAAIQSSLLAFLASGDHVVSGDTLYGPSIRVIGEFFGRFGITSTFVDTADLKAVAAAFRPETKAVFFETPANPTCKITDIAAVAKLARERKALTVVDNTFCTPFFQRPLDLGADVVVHSATKYLNGHGDVVAGITACRKDLAAKIRSYRQEMGAILGPFDSYLFLRGVRTLSVRMERHQTNGLAVARFLEKHPAVAKVHHPGLESFPGHEIAKRQMSGFPSVFSFELKGGLAAGRELLRRVKVCTLAVSLGTLDTLIQHPASMTHAGVPAELRRKQGLTDGLVRISVGLEHPDDVCADLAQAIG